LNCLTKRLVHLTLAADCHTVKNKISYDVFFHVRLKDDLPMSDVISSQDRIRTYSDGILSISNIEPSDHGSYVCIISILNSANVRSEPAIITVKCKFIYDFILIIKKKN